MMKRLVALVIAGAAALAAEPQNPSPMVEHTREHPRLQEQHPPGRHEQLDRGVLFIPEALEKQPALPLMVFFKGGLWIPEVVAAQSKCAVLHWHTTDGFGYGDPFEKEGVFAGWLQNAAKRAGKNWSSVTIGGWSAGCGGVRQILAHAQDRAAVDAVLLIDGVHAPYAAGKPGPLESELDVAKLAGLRDFAREAAAGRKTMLVLHTEIFPGTFASTTETADWLVRELELKRQPVLKWGPMGTQQLSEAASGRFTLRGYAGNSAPDHVDLLHALPQIFGDLAGLAKR